jgi:hypothetical protein
MSPTRGTHSQARWSVVRPVLVGLVTAAAPVAAAPLCADPLIEVRTRVVAGAGWDTLPLDLVIASLASAALGLCGLWLAAVTLATTVEAVTGRSCAAVRAVTPLAVRRGVLAFCGLAIGSSGIVLPATAAPLEPTPTAARTVATAALDGLPLPDRVEGEAPAAAPHRPEPQRHRPRLAKGPGPGAARAAPVSAALPAGAVHRVRAGDTLWSIAASLLPAADAAEVDRAWHRIYRVNRTVVGSDPDLVLPGTTLRLPDRLTSADRTNGPRLPGGPSHRKDAS